jgi:hypothetical protein
MHTPTRHTPPPAACPPPASRVAAHVQRLLRRALAVESGRAHAVEPLETREHLSVGFSSGPSTPLAVGPNVVADFNGDGFQDIAFTSGIPDNILNIATSNSDGSFTFTGTYDSPFALTGSFPAGLLAGDYDGDNDIDVISTGGIFWRNTGGGIFNAGQAFTITPAITQRDLTTINFNGDSRPDLIVLQSSGRLAILPNQGNTGLIWDGSGPSITLDSTYRFVLGTPTGNLNNDSRQDFLMYDAENSRVLSFLNTTTGILSGQTITGVDQNPFAADINGDTYLDFVWGEGSGTSSKLMAVFGSATGFSAKTQIRESASGGYLSVSAFDDVDRDGDKDLIVLRETDTNRVFVALLNTNGFFDGLEINAITLSLTTAPGSVLAGDFNRDSRADLIRFTSGQLATQLSVPGPAITTFTAPTTRVVPGEFLVAQATNVTRGAVDRAVTGVRFFLDSNNNGRLDQQDKLLSTVTLDTSNNAPLNVVVEDGLVSGQIKLFAIATDALGTSNVFEQTIALWTRVMYPEGYRAIGNVNEFVPIVNDNNVNVAYRLVLRYESGERDLVLDENTIGPNRRGGATVTTREMTAEQSPVRPDTPYAFELQSALPLGAQLSRYDTFGVPNGVNGTGEAFTNRTATKWAFADTNAKSGVLDFVVFYNPNPTVTVVTITLTNGVTGAEQTITSTLQPYRRAGLSLLGAADAGLVNRFQDFVVTLDATNKIVAAQSRYQPGQGRAFTSLGQALDFDGAPATTTDLVISGVDIRSTVTNNTVLFNPSTTPVIATITGSYEGSTQRTSRTVTVPARQRLLVNLSQGAPGGASAGGFRITAAAPLYAFTESIDAGRLDSLGTSIGTFASTKWGFGDGFLHRSLLGDKSFASLNLFNPSATVVANVTLRFLFWNGTSATSTLTIQPNSSRVIKLHELAALTQAQTSPDLSWYSAVAQSDLPIVAGQTHWDLLQPGGWTTLGSPLDSIVPLS